MAPTCSKKKLAKTMDDLPFTLLLHNADLSNPRKPTAYYSLHTFHNLHTRLRIHRGIASSAPHVRKDQPFLSAQLGAAHRVQKPHGNFRDIKSLLRNNHYNNSRNNMSDRNISQAFQKVTTRGTFFSKPSPNSHS